MEPRCILLCVLYVTGYVTMVVHVALACDACTNSYGSRDCICPSVTAPGNLTVNQTPQFVLVSFDDAVTPANINFYRRLFHPNRTNSNECPISGTFFVTDDGDTDYFLVKELYQKGHAINSHSLSHPSPDWWHSASDSKLAEEFSGQRSKIANLSQIPESEIKGTRVPFLSLGGDGMYNVIQSCGFKYDSSFSMGPLSPTKNEKLLFPFTLDSPDQYMSTCTIPICPTGKFPGLWEIPLVRLYGNQNDVCAMTDGCKTTSAQDVHNYLKNNFMRYYKTNRAPFGVHLHATWFRTLYNLEGMDSFIKELVDIPNVWFINMNQMIEWMKHPASLNAMKNSTPWSLSGKC